MKKRFAVFIIFVFSLSAILTAIFIFHKKPDYGSITLTVASTEDMSGSLYDGAQIFSEEYGCTVEFTDNFESCDLIYSSGEDFSQCQPITKYINTNSRLYSKQIIRDTCTRDGEIYGITNVLVGRLNYCTYSPDQFTDTPLPYDYYRKGKWTWDSFIEMAGSINGNIAVNWNESYINMRHALFLDDSGNTVFDYGTQEQVEWLNFVRTLIYDDGIVNNTEGAFKVGFLPGLMLDSVGDEASMRYIPWPTKNGKLSPMFVDEYHFCVPKNAQNPKLSIKLANAMIKSCTETRMNLYEASMTKEDFKLFKKQLRKIYTYPAHTDYVPAQTMIDDFVHGKTVTEHIFNTENNTVHIK
ncbi:MAG: hypothetical protein PUE13_05640 [Clostridiales bacterium]|nr:hypothetical protein [Clostridiales bacterium]